MRVSAVPLALVLLLALGLPAAAQPNPGPQPPQVEQAVQKYQKGDLKGAIALLEPLKGKSGTHPAALSLLGTLYLEAGRPQDSLALLGPLADTEAAGPVILHNAARAALALEQIEKAAAYLTRAVNKAPVSPASRDLGLLHGSQGRIAESYRLLRPWVQAHPEDQEARLAAAFSALELERLPEAREMLQGLPEVPQVRLLQGRLQLLERDPRQAVATLKPLLTAGIPSLEPSARRYLAEAHLALGESAEAVAVLERKTGSDPSLALLLGRARYQSGDPAGAVTTLELVAGRLLAQEPASREERSLAASVAFEYGQALVATSKWPEAISALEKATQLDPRNSLAWQLLGRAQLAGGRREEAAQSMEKFRQLQSAEKEVSQQVQEADLATKDPTGRNLDRAMELLAQGKGEEALAMIRQEAELAPASDVRPRAAEVAALISLKRPEEALKAAEAALAAAPGNKDFLYLRGTVRLALQQLPEAETDLRQVLAIQPNHLPALNDLAVIAIAQGRKDEARELLNKVLAAKPGDPVATANLKRLE